ncbi:MAG: SHOCT domain-containing protein [Sphingosinicella sp.]|uniref:SHOCT domain-containing protein n=1 Tax=Sphingosinicella sp. TaxID=1917971 RepID=UPI004037D5A6
MRTGKLAISRGHQLAEPADVRPAQLAIVPSAPPPTSETNREAEAPAGLPVNERLDALERLVRLAEQGAFTAEEFAAEKALILGRAPASPELPVAPARGPSLLGRLLNWKLIPVGLAAGIGLSWFAQSAETARFFAEALRLFGA